MILRGTISRRHGARELLFAVCLAGAAVGGLSACVGERAFAIIQNQIPTADCVIPGQETDTYRSSGLLDTQGKQGYLLFPLLRNDLLPTAATDGQPERNRIYLRRFEVSLDLEGAVAGEVPSELTEFSVPTSAEMTPGQLRSSSVQVIPDLLIPFLTVPQGFRPTVSVSVTAVANHNGSEIESPEFIFPVEICSGCLVQLLGTCPGADDEVTLLPNACGIPQDGPVTCCGDSARGVVCLPGGGN